VNYDGKIAENARKQQTLRKNISEGAVKVLKDETNAAIRARTEAIDDQIVLMRKGYDEDFKLASKTHEEKLKLLQKEKKSTLEEQESYPADRPRKAAPQLRGGDPDLRGPSSGALREKPEGRSAQDQPERHDDRDAARAAASAHGAARQSRKKSPLGAQIDAEARRLREARGGSGDQFIDKLQRVDRGQQGGRSPARPASSPSSSTCSRTRPRRSSARSTIPSSRRTSTA
jgi:hypothetical protein